MSLDASWAKVLTDWAQYFATGALGGALTLWATLRRREQRLSASLQAVQSDLARHAERLTIAEFKADTLPAHCQAHQARLSGMEDAINRGPHHRDLAKLREDSQAGLVRVHERVDKMEKALGRIEGTLSGVERTVSKIDLYLTEHGPRAGDRHGS